MEKKLIAMAREMEKFRLEIANEEKRARASAVAATAAGNPGTVIACENNNHGMKQCYGFRKLPFKVKMTKVLSPMLISNIVIHLLHEPGNIYYISNVFS
ncbi:unnamed protein product [Vicia faba]|uniref:Uncharacterized protein n=1 Tax=Vicia faba TaxID=3906 RepID=A0AAV0ZQ19_VICFA|nr:unnamed protein product [Vicia faba]